MELNPDFWRRCSSCKTPIKYSAKYFVCSVSTCNRKRIGYVFDSVHCWERHLPGARHKDAAAVEAMSPTFAAWKAELGPDAEPPRAVGSGSSAAVSGGSAVSASTTASSGGSTVASASTTPASSSSIASSAAASEPGVTSSSSSAGSAADSQRPVDPTSSSISQGSSSSPNRFPQTSSGTKPGLTAEQQAAAVASARAPQRVILGGAPTTTGPKKFNDSLESEILVVVSKMKNYVKERADMNTSDSVSQLISDRIRRLCDRAIENARADGRKTIMDRDFDR